MGEGSGGASYGNGKWLGAWSGSSPVEAGAGLSPRAKGAGGGQRLYGPLIGCRGFLHAPANEAGVVCLFGMLAADLGFMIERVRSGYPDCEAKRLVDGHHMLWAKCRIEFEYLSRNFEAHGHDPSKVDLIVCWDHNWGECPVDVLSLRRAVERMSRPEGWRDGGSLLGVGLWEAEKREELARKERRGRKGAAVQ